MSRTSKSLSVVVRADQQGHWVEWIIDRETGTLGPYQDDRTAQNVRSAKEREFAENTGHISEA